MLALFGCMRICFTFGRPSLVKRAAQCCCHAQIIICITISIRTTTTINIINITIANIMFIIIISIIIIM